MMIWTIIVDLYLNDNQVSSQNLDISNFSLNYIRHSSQSIPSIPMLWEGGWKRCASPWHLLIASEKLILANKESSVIKILKSVQLIHHWQPVR